LAYAQNYEHAEARFLQMTAGHLFRGLGEWNPGKRKPMEEVDFKQSGLLFFFEMSHNLEGDNVFDGQDRGV
jgi:hypothetical protein